MRELSDATINDQAQALATYLRKQDNRGAARWLDSKDFGFDDRAAILVALADLESEVA